MYRVDEDQDGPGDAGCGRRGGMIGGRVVCLRHGTMSLALSVYLGMVEKRQSCVALRCVGRETQIPRCACLPQAGSE